jgi:hypothetical protein
MRNMKAKRKLAWMSAVAALVVVSAVSWAQTSESTDLQAPGNGIATSVAEVPRFSNDVPGTPPSSGQVRAQLSATATGPAFRVLPPAAFTSDGIESGGYFMSFSKATL